MEVLAGGWHRLNNDWVLRGGVGRGITPGIGSPTARVVLAIAYEKPLDQDRDLDGILDSADACPEQPEDFDQFEDVNGCPDVDNDGDGLTDADDTCPNDAEDADGFADDDGCPDASVPVSFAVFGPDGSPLEEATLQVMGPQEASGHHGMSTELHNGTYTLQAAAIDYEVVELEFTVPGQTEVVVRMNAVPGDLKVLAMTPDGQRIEGASYTFDGRPGAVMVDGEVTTQVPSGSYTIVVRADGFAPFKHLSLIHI